MGMTALFIDGAYLDKVRERTAPGVSLEYSRLAQVLVEPDEMLRTYYYHCLPWMSDVPDVGESERFARSRRFLTALSFQPRFEVRLGRLARRGIDSTGRPIFVQKRVDTMIGVDMALLASKGRVGRIALLSGDSDYLPAIEAVKREGVLTVLWHGRVGSRVGPSRELFEICDDRRELTPELLAQVARQH